MTGCGPHSYATIEDLASAGIPAAASSTVPPSVKQRMLVRASAKADTFLRDRYTLPLLCSCGRQCGWDPSLVDAVCQIATWDLMRYAGFDPELGSDWKIIRTGYEDAIAFLKSVANGQAQLQVCQSLPASEQPHVSSNVPRGYGAFGELNALNAPVAGGRAGGWGT